MPVNNVYNIQELMKACKYYIEKTNKRISFEYALAKDNNDNLQDAKELVALLKGMLCHVNLIPINKIEDGKYSKSSRACLTNNMVHKEASRYTIKYIGRLSYGFIGENVKAPTSAS